MLSRIYYVTDTEGNTAILISNIWQTPMHFKLF